MKKLLIVCLCTLVLCIMSSPAISQDSDGDGVPDSVDNCIDYPNGPNLGTCTNTTTGIVSTGQVCTVDGDCDPGEFCEKVQADTYPPGGNNCGDACDCEGNLNADPGGVDTTDSILFQQDYGRTDCNNDNPCNGDFDCDGDVDGGDLGVPPYSGDTAKFIEDIGRSFLNTPCPACSIFPLRTDPWCEYTEPTVFPEIQTNCPVVTTECPTLQTECPSDIPTWCPEQPTLCPKVPDVCPPDEFTIWPQIPTECPVIFTACPQGPTLCPPLPTDCPGTDTWCPEIPTQCPLEPVFTFCPLNDTQCPDIPTNCPLDWTFCPNIPTVCPDIVTECPAVITTCPSTLPTFCPVEPTNCPTDPTNCPEVSTTCPVDLTICGPTVDSDGDGIDDCNDNCPNNPNGPSQGTCMISTPEGNIVVSYGVWVCTVDGNCPIDMFCENVQADTYPPGGNGIGDVCDCEANFNCDLDVDGEELTAFLADFGRGQYDRPCDSVLPTCNGDFTCDGDVDGGDLTKFLEDFGRGQYDRPCPICDGSMWCSY